MKKALSLLFLCAGTLLLNGCTLKNWYCPKDELQQYLLQADQTALIFQEKTGESNNQPEKKPEILLELKSLSQEYESMKLPLCLRKHRDLISEAMNTSLKFLSPERDRYYEKYELWYFATKDWQAVEDEEQRLIEKYLDHMNSE